MSSYLNPDPGCDIRDISALGLAHVGDAVYELMVRTWLCTTGSSTAKQLHGGAVGLVSAKAQAEAAERIAPDLREDEAAVFRRGRNAHVSSIPKGATYEDYHAATGIETLFGYLYLSSRQERLDELFDIIVR